MQRPISSDGPPFASEHCPCTECRPRQITITAGALTVVASLFIALIAVIRGTTEPTGIAGLAVIIFLIGVAVLVSSSAYGALRPPRCSLRRENP